ncbi:MAG: hypothetical protein EAZ34_02550 [Polaromonas sp.]|nr:MAG: hypothetical protein EAZ34_02550 [Polaromonas sp.]
MTKIIFLFLMLNCGFTASAQTVEERDVLPAAQPMTPDAERLRINAQRARLETGFGLESAACYQKFLVNRCLDDIKLRRRETLADLRRQEIALNALDRKAKAAGQIRKTQEKSSPDNQQQDAEKRAAALADLQVRMNRGEQKNAARTAARANESANSQAFAKRIKSQQDEAIARNRKQTDAAEKVRQLNARQEKARARRIQRDLDLLSQTRPAQRLPVPE